MESRLLKELKARTDIMPTCMEYKELMDYAVQSTGKTREEIFSLVGIATYAQWADFLGIA